MSTLCFTTYYQNQMSSLRVDIEVVGESNRSNYAIVLKNGFILFCSVVRLLTIISGDLPHILTSKAVKNHGYDHFPAHWQFSVWTTSLLSKGFP